MSDLMLDLTRTELAEAVVRLEAENARLRSAATAAIRCCELLYDQELIRTIPQAIRDLRATLAGVPHA